MPTVCCATQRRDSAFFTRRPRSRHSFLEGRGGRGLRPSPDTLVTPPGPSQPAVYNSDLTVEAQEALACPDFRRSKRIPSLWL